MGQAKKENIARLQLGEGTKFELTGFSKIRVCSVHRLSREPLGSDLLDGALRMKEEQTKKLSPRVPRSADDGDVYHVSTPKVKSTTRAGMFTPVVSMLFLNSIV